LNLCHVVTAEQACYPPTPSSEVYDHPRSEAEGTLGIERSMTNRSAYRKPCSAGFRVSTHQCLQPRRSRTLTTRSPPTVFCTYWESLSWTSPPFVLIRR